MFSLYFPIAQTSMSILVLFALGGTVGFVSGLFGVGGGFLLTPLLILVGIPPTVAAASDSTQTVAATASGAYAHARMRHVDYRMGLLLLAGTLGGGSLGVMAIKLLRRLGEADFAISVCYVVMLGGIGLFMFVESLKSLAIGKKWTRRASAKKETSIPEFIQALPFKVRFPLSDIEVSPIAPVVVGAIIGLLSAIMGLGGGFMMVPAMIYLLGMPVYAAIGTNLFQGCFSVQT